MSERFEKTLLWQRTLGAQDGDQDSEAREILRRAYLDMRSSVSVLVDQIRTNCRELTVHDVTHLDALWETADLIIGPTYPVNPAEAFVFGASVLLHDAAMSLAAFQNGIDDLYSLSEWADSVAELAAAHIDRNPDDTHLKEAEPELRGKVIFNVLRLLHARQAERLLELTFSRPKKDEALRLLENTSLRDAFGYSIGRIAHSHHWDIRELLTGLEKHVGPSVVLPQSWAVNEIKIACMLRCADAAHLDARRAPTFLYAIMRPSGISDLHWSFQNKLNQVTVDNEKVVFSSGVSFSRSDADAWWLAYENAQMVDREIRKSNATLEEIGEQPFRATGVAGVESPHMFARKVRVSGWEPVDAEVRVSDPVHLAKTLGGENLYGDDKLAPLRELLQNAVDAIRARRSHDGKPSDWGCVTVHVYSTTDGNWLHVEDDGIGMSQRVLTGPLIDFGNSFWSSSLASEEFPGLRGSRVRTAGKFGIGFFSIFLLGDKVKVISRRYDAGRNDARVLEFPRLSKRPLLRAPTGDEALGDSSTSVRVELSDDQLARAAETKFIPERNRSITHPAMAQRLLKTIVSLDVNVKMYINKKMVWEHSANWIEAPSENFLEELFATYPDTERKQQVAAYADRLRLIRTTDGEVIGRAALNLQEGRGPFAVSVDGFAVDGGRGARIVGYPDYELPMFHLPGVVGVVVGETRDASRKTAAFEINPDALGKWASEQVALIPRDKFKPDQLMQLAATIIELGGDPGDLPVSFLGGKFAGIKAVKDWLRSSAEIVLPLRIPYGTTLYTLDVSELRADFFLLTVGQNVIVPWSGERHDELLDKYQSRRVVEDSEKHIEADEVDALMARALPKWLNGLIRQAWPEGQEAEVARYRIFEDDLFTPPGSHWAMRLVRRPAS